MATQTFKLPKAPQEPPPFRLEPFQGVNLSATPSQISDHESPDALNGNTDETGAFTKRPGYERVFQTSLGPGKINGLFHYDKPDGTAVFLIAHKTELYTQTGSDQPVQIYTGKADNDTKFFVMRDKDGKDVCYIMDGTTYLVYDGTTVSNVLSNPYIPTLTIANSPNGGGSPNEDFNLLGAGFKDSFSGTGTDTIYQLSLTGLDATTVTAEVDGVAKTEGTDFTVDRTLGKVTFTNAPSSGTDNVIITAYKTFADKPSQILKCTFNTLFGGNNDTRAFVGGNPDFPNQVWRLGLYDATYAPENGFYKVGDHTPVTGFVKQYDYLLIEKKSKKWVMHYELNNGVATFPLKPVNEQAGTIATKTIQIIENNPISLDMKGVYIVTASNIRDERNIKHISTNVDPKLLKEPNLENAVAIDFDMKYWLIVNGNGYIYDYQKGFWYLYDNIHANCFLVADNYLYFGSDSEGLVYKFKKITDTLPYNDDGVAINAYWYTKLIDFHTPEMLKIVRHVYMTIKPDTHTSAELYLRTDKKAEHFIATKRMDQFNLFNFDLNRFTLKTSKIPQEISKKVKEKKITHFQVKFQNNAVDESLGVTSLGIKYAFLREVK